MLRILSAAVLTAALAATALAAPDDTKFQRERKPSNQAAKNALEGKAPPKLDVTGWKNSKPISLEKLRGKVVVIDFWGTW